MDAIQFQCRESCCFENTISTVPSKSLGFVRPNFPLLANHPFNWDNFPFLTPPFQLGEEKWKLEENFQYKYRSDLLTSQRMETSKYI